MEQPPVNFGLETEYGISREGSEDELDVVAESIALVRATKQKAVRMRWDYDFEDPHLDARGFRVKELLQDVDEANYFARDAARALTYSEIKSDLVLKNGARFYNDHAHPEYCTPECLSLVDLLHQDHLGDQLVMQCAEKLSEASRGGRVLIYKNNTDFRGHSYGCHENYLVPRAMTWQTLSQGMMAFLVTRQIYSGAGKYGWEEEDQFQKPGFQISQRADFFSTLESVDTMQRRPIVNTRDEPHADPSIFRRFHVICGDANLAEMSTYLKVGATAAVLQALANGAAPSSVPILADPVRSIREISRDTTLRWELRLRDGKNSTAVEVQRDYLALAEQYGGGTPAFLEEWREILTDLENDPLKTANRLDWAAKYRLIEQFRESEGLAEDDPWLRSLDLAYHLLDEKEGLYFGLLDSGQMSAPYSVRRRLSGGDFHPPEGTRARIRGACIEHFGSWVELAQWDHVRLNQNGFRLELNLRALFQEDQIHAAWKTVMNAKTVRDLTCLPFAKRLDNP